MSLQCCSSLRRKLTTYNLFCQFHNVMFAFSTNTSQGIIIGGILYEGKMSCSRNTKAKTWISFLSGRGILPNAKRQMPNAERQMPKRRTTERRMLVSGFSCETCAAELLLSCFALNSSVEKCRHCTMIIVYIVSLDYPLELSPRHFVSTIEQFSIDCRK